MMGSRLIFAISLTVALLSVGLLGLALVLLSRSDLLSGAVAAATGLFALAGATSLVRLSLHLERRTP